MSPFLRFVRQYTVEQWLAIDRDHRRESLPDPRAAAVLVTAAVCLVIPRYFGSPSSFGHYPFLNRLFAWLPYPDLPPHLFWALSKIFNYGLIPWLCIKYVLQSDARAHGLRFVWEPKVWALYGGMLCLVLPLTYLAASSDSFLRTYPKYPGAGDSLTQLVLWEAAYAFQFLMLEFFFRGFLLFALSRFIGSLAIFVMVVPYAMIHLAKPMPECLGSILTGIALGTIALRTGSIYGGVVVHSLVAWSMDLFAIVEKGKFTQLFR